MHTIMVTVPEITFSPHYDNWLIVVGYDNWLIDFMHCATMVDWIIIQLLFDWIIACMTRYTGVPIKVPSKCIVILILILILMLEN